MFGVTLPNAVLEVVEPALLVSDHLLALVGGQRVQGSDERSVGIGRPPKLELSSNR
jgi:hypothetical protein